MFRTIIFSSIAAIILCYSEMVFSVTQKNWAGFYLGGNAGYWQSQINNVSTSGAVNFVNPTYELGASNIANALAQIATNKSSINSYGFIGGGQAGYNYELNKRILLGLNIDLEGLANSNNSTTVQKTVNLVDYDENYAGSLSINEKINYLGTLGARLGYLYNPTLLLYATGGLAYGNVSLNTAWTAQESLGSDVFPMINTQNNTQKTVTGWAAGAGIEWLFKPNWSAMLEYKYYSLNNLNASSTLAQMNNAVTPAALWGSAVANTVSSLSLWNIRVGLNYHFL